MGLSASLSLLHSFRSQKIQMTEDVESKAAISPWASSKVLIGLVVVAFSLLVAGLWRRWKAAV